MFTRRHALLAALLLASPMAIAPGFAHQVKFGDLVIIHPWSRPSPMAAGVEAGFLSIVNNGTAGDRLVKATAEISPKVQLHDMKMEGEVMKMVELPEGIPIPAGQRVDLKPKLLHVMFFDIKSMPEEGQVFKGTLTFEKAGTVDIEYEVMAPDAGMN